MMRSHLIILRFRSYVVGYRLGVTYTPAQIIIYYYVSIPNSPPTLMRIFTFFAYINVLWMYAISSIEIIPASRESFIFRDYSITFYL